MIMKKIIITFLAIILVAIPSMSQIMLSPVITSTIPGLTNNNASIIDGRLRHIISASGMESGYDGGRFVIACRVAALQRVVSGAKLIQKLEVTFAIGDNLANTCFGSTTYECIGVGEDQEDAMTNALKNIKVNTKLRELITGAKERIITYYEQNGPAIIQKAQGYITAQEWEEALYELSAIPQECSCYKQALAMMNNVYEAHINHDAAAILAEAQAVWSSDPNPGYGAEEAMRILSQIDPSAACYPQAQALMKRIETRVKNVTDTQAAHERNMEKARINAEVAIAKARATAIAGVVKAYVQRKPRVVVNNYRSWY